MSDVTFQDLQAKLDNLSTKDIVHIATLQGIEIPQEIMEEMVFAPHVNFKGTGGNEDRGYLSTQGLEVTLGGAAADKSRGLFVPVRCLDQVKGIVDLAIKTAKEMGLNTSPAETCRVDGQPLQFVMDGKTKKLVG